MKKLWNVLVLTLALNFVLLAGGIGYLYQTKRIDKEKVHAIKEVLFPPPAVDPPTTQPTSQPATQPVLDLDALLAAHASLPAAEQVQLLQRTFDFRMTELDRRNREIASQFDLVKNAQAQLQAERQAFEVRRAALETREQQATRLAADKGFQDALKLYETLKPKQVKDVFAGLADEVVVRYLRAMEPVRAAKIIKEFKTPAEVQRVKVLMEQVRAAETGSASAQP